MMEKQREMVSKFLAQSNVIAQELHLKAGYVWAPYVSKEITGPVEPYKEEKILKVKEWLRAQRYSKKQINPNFYSNVDVSGLDVTAELERIFTEEIKVAVENEKIKAK